MEHNLFSLALGRAVQCLLYRVGLKRTAVKCRRIVDDAELRAIYSSMRR